MTELKYDYGMIGLGTMGRNLVLNINDKGYTVAGFDKDRGQVEMLRKSGDASRLICTSNLQEWINVLKCPRVILLLVPAGKIVDEVIKELEPLLSENDLLLDCGNSHFSDTNKRIDRLLKSKIHFMGVGVSGGESGARFGPSIMPGGAKHEYDRVKEMLEAIAAKIKGAPCVAWLGEGSAGHYVKMVHNGIEYGLMQLISEVYHFLKIGRGMNNDELHTVFSKWNEGSLRSYLMEITAEIFKQKDDRSDQELIDKILDSAHQNGTGGWTSEDAINLQVPIPVIDAAVSMRAISSFKKQRELLQQKLEGPDVVFENDNTELLAWMEKALYFSMITTYTQGMSLLSAASEKYRYDLNLGNIATVWRGGCIIRASLLDDINDAFSKQPGLSNLMFDEQISQQLNHSQHGLRKVIQMGVEAGLPLPAMMSALAYYDSYRSAWLPANLIQAQRDFFGAHTYERNDRAGVFHTQWHQKEKPDGIDN